MRGHIGHSEVNRDDLKSNPNSYMLVVEDNKINQQYLCGLLMNWRIGYDIANNGSEAVKLASTRNYDMILMDIRMPVVDGYEATIRIRSEESSLNRNTPIVALTASGLIDGKEKVMAVGMNEHVTKPFSPAQLAGIFKRFGIAGFFTTDVPAFFRFSSVLNSQYLEELYADDLERAQIIFEIFVANIESEISTLEATYLAGDWPSFATQAHKLKPNFHMVGITEFAEMMSLFEKMKDGPNPEAGHVQKMTQLREKFQYYYDIVCDELNKLNSFLGI